MRMILSPGQYTRLADIFIDVSKAAFIGLFITPVIQKNSTVRTVSIIYLLVVICSATIATLYFQERKEHHHASQSR